MKAAVTPLLQFIKSTPQFIVPIYQRHYSWTKAQCQQLWDDIIQKNTGGDSTTNHFIGTIVYVTPARDGKHPVGVIDGQQRLTTVLLLLKAIADYVNEHGVKQQKPERISPKEIDSYLFANHGINTDNPHKLVLSEADQETFAAIIGDTPLPEHPSPLLIGNFEFFTNLLQQTESDVSRIYRGLSRLTVVEIALDATKDNPQLIFESINSTGIPLSQADLIRNFILLGHDPIVQSDLYSRFWRPMEIIFGRRNYPTRFDAFMRHYLTIKTGEISRISDVYQSFKRYFQAIDISTEYLLTDLHRFAGYYGAIALGQEPNVLLQQAFANISELGIEAPYPFLLQMYDFCQHGSLSAQDVHRMAQIVASYIVRRSVCGIPSTALGYFFASLATQLDETEYPESLEALLWLQTSTLRFPRDKEFIKELTTRDIYNSRNARYLLTRLEQFGSGTTINFEHFSIEHILPQNKELSPSWQDALGPEWEDLQEQWVHTLGNLTLTEHNTEYGDNPFIFKRDLVTTMDGTPIGLAHSRLFLNRGLLSVKQWDADAIQARAAALATLATQIWKAPVGTERAIEWHRRTRSTPSVTPEDYPQLQRPELRELFENLRAKALALDSRIHERFFKSSIGYRLHTHIFDIEFLSRKLMLYFYAPPNEISDPLQLTEDVSSTARYTGRDIAFSLESLEDLPYAVDLVRQALARHLRHYS